jgi:hypothetical protein
MLTNLKKKTNQIQDSPNSGHLMYKTNILFWDQVQTPVNQMYNQQSASSISAGAPLEWRPCLQYL